MKRFLAYVMSMALTVSSLSCANATYVYADTIAGNYVSMGVMISLLFSAYGIQRTIDGSQYINNLIQQCAQEATETGFGMLKNGVQSIGVTIQNGVSYVQKSFAEWVYNWALENNIFDVSQGSTPEWYTFQYGQTYTITSGLTLYQLAPIAGLPDGLVSICASSGVINANDFCVIEKAYRPRDTQTTFFVASFPSGTELSFTYGSADNPKTSGIHGGQVIYKPSTGYMSDHVTNHDFAVTNTREWETGSDSSYVLHNFYNGLNGTLSGSLDYGVTNDIPDVSEDLDSYASDWVQDGITIDEDGTSEDYIPVTLPIDGVGTAVGVVEGTEEAINSAGALDQYDVRTGTISDDAVADLQEAVQDSESEEELKDDLSIQGLETVFPFCLPWDFASFISLLRADPVAPKFELQALNADGETISYTFDLSTFDSVALVCRNMELLAFIIALILLTKGFFV